MLNKKEAVQKLDDLGSLNTPFSFYCDFLGEEWCIEEGIIEPPEKSFQLDIGEEKISNKVPSIEFNKTPIGYTHFKKPFDRVVSEINFGNSFLTNLTFQTPIQTNLTLEEIFHHSKAKYKLFVPEQFVVFSPETFLKIQNNCVYSYPMKGTIDAEAPDAEQTILNDPKEIAEHVTIVDLIRNDLSLVASKVEVTKFRYLDQIQTNNKKLLQVSSEIKGFLGENWKSNLGSILVKLLPAGSISGAPKPETVRIIQENEPHQRGFYTGICGHFDGKSLDTGVMIRFIKKVKNKLIYCSGGGITSFSEAEKEYQEMIDKIYLAI